MSVSKLQLGREGETGQVISTTVSDADNEFKYKNSPIYQYLEGESQLFGLPEKLPACKKL